MTSLIARGYIDQQLGSTDSASLLNIRRYHHAARQKQTPSMSSSQSTNNDRTTQPYLLVPNLHVADPTAREIDLGSHPWMVATVIEDDDLTFGGKPLSTWYEEDRRRLSTGYEEEERRGRQRERVRIDGHHPHHHHHHHHHLKQPPPPQQHCKKTLESKQ